MIYKSDCLVRYPDREQFDAWFLTQYPMPRTIAQRANWKHKRNMAWLGWLGARNTPPPPPTKNSLTSMSFAPLTPEEFVKAATG